MARLPMVVAINSNWGIVRCEIGATQLLAKININSFAPGALCTRHAMQANESFAVSQNTGSSYWPLSDLEL